MIKQFKSKLLILMITLCSLVCLFTITSNVLAAASALELIIVGPGENASTEMLFSWRSTSKTATFYYTDELNTPLNDWYSIEVNGEYEDSIFTEEKIANYRFELELTDLTPNTKYAYTIKSSSTTAETHYFQTAGETGNFNFL